MSRPHPGPYTDTELVPVLQEKLGKTFRGLLMGDQGERLGRPDTLRPGETLLVNLDSTGGPGTHWGILRASLEKPGIVLWWDSLGLMPPLSITRGTRAGGRQIVASDAAVQRIRQANDSLCGPRAVLAALHLAESPKKDLKAFADLSKD